MSRKRNKLERSGRWQVVSLPESGSVGTPHTPGACDDPVEQLIARARKLRGRGELRKALVVLRQACVQDEWRARSWTLLGMALADAGHVDEGLRALRHARWLRTRGGEHARAAVTARLIERVTLAA